MKVVIVGGGVAAYRMVIGLANRLDIQVQLVSDDLTVFSPDAASILDDSCMTQSIRSASEHAQNIELYEDTVSAINARVKAIKGVSGTIYRYDTLVICDEGSVSVIPGSVDFSYNLYSQEARNELRTALNHLCKLSHRTSLRMLIIGGGKTGVELAASLPLYIKTITHRFSLPPKHIAVELFEKGSRLVPTMSATASEKVKNYLSSLGVVVREATQVTECRQNIIQTEKQEYAGDLIIYAGGYGYGQILHKYPETFEFHDGDLVLSENGSVPKAPDVFVLSGLLDSGIAPEALIEAADKLVAGLTGKKVRKAKLPYIQTVRLGQKCALYQKGARIKSGRSGSALSKKLQKNILKRMESRK
jgi:NADH dehydrogenase FAD-containing subunit